MVVDISEVDCFIQREQAVLRFQSGFCMRWSLPELDDNKPVQGTSCCPFTLKPSLPEEINTHQSLCELIALLLVENARLSREKETMVEALDQLDQLNRDKDKFFSIISHDLRGPFFSLKGFAHSLWQELNSDQEVAPEDIKMMAQSILFLKMFTQVVHITETVTCLIKATIFTTQDGLPE